jgi:hypothetical protein
MVIPPAKTGKDKTNKSAVITIDQTNKVILSKLISTPRLFQQVVIKFTLLRILLTPAICKLKMTESTLFPMCPSLLSGG